MAQLGSGLSVCESNSPFPLVSTKVYPTIVKKGSTTFILIAFDVQPEILSWKYKFASPAPMPHDAKDYASKVSMVNFVNSYYQIRDCVRFQPNKVLIVGVGVGLEAIILREKYNVNVKTLDIDPGFFPDHVGSIHDLSGFPDQSFRPCRSSDCCGCVEQCEYHHH